MGHFVQDFCELLVIVKLRNHHDHELLAHIETTIDYLRHFIRKLFVWVHNRQEVFVFATFLRIEHHLSRELT